MLVTKKFAECIMEINTLLYANFLEHQQRRESSFGEENFVQALRRLVDGATPTGGFIESQNFVVSDQKVCSLYNDLSHVGVSGVFPGLRRYEQSSAENPKSGGTLPGALK